ncbi:MAG: SDR family oxidoreductase [Leptospiraceae bacterium]|nr:SDR family oxidoreductase [Leptospiraceae bacterium]MCP5497437.1 SDR family oxidoreductase [Leptospiraceae bacterium]
MQAKNEKTVLITGATGGLGKAISGVFYKNNYNLVLVSRDLERLDQVSENLKASNPDMETNIHLYPLNFELATENDYKMLFQFSMDNIIFPQAIINNAGIIGEFGESWKIPIEAYQNAFSVNLYSAINMCKLFLPKMIENNYGKIVSISGGGATGAREKFSPYSLSKVALVRYMENLSKELQSLRLNIDVNCIAPGAMKTQMTEHILIAGEEKAGKKEIDSLKKQLKEGGISPTKAADLCYFLASPESDGITGRLISAVWDDWKTLPQRRSDIQNTDIYTLKRITAKDRGFNWD